MIYALPLIFFFPFVVMAEVSPEGIMRETFAVSDVQKRPLLLGRQEFEHFEGLAKVHLKEQVYRYYLAFDGKKKLRGSGVLLTLRVRTKDMTVLYLIEDKKQIKHIEILRFLEPPEYEPSEKWVKRLSGQALSDELRIGSKVTNITGATLSARSVTEGARIALALITSKGVK